jgi:hypothetical protein
MNTVDLSGYSSSQLGEVHSRKPNPKLLILTKVLTKAPAVAPVPYKGCGSKNQSLSPSRRPEMRVRSLERGQTVSHLIEKGYISLVS